MWNGTKPPAIHFHVPRRGITQTSELSVGRSEKPIMPLVQAYRSGPDSAKPHTKAVSLNQKHPFNQFNLIWEFTLFLYHAKMMRDLNPLQNQKQLLWRKWITIPFGQPEAVLMCTRAVGSGTFPCCLVRWNCLVLQAEQAEEDHTGDRGMANEEAQLKEIFPFCTAALPCTQWWGQNRASTLTFNVNFPARGFKTSVILADI